MSIKIPWTSPMSSTWTIDLDGLHLLVVPSTSVHYDEKKEKEIEFQAKLQRLQKIEDQIEMEKDNDNADGDKDASSDSFFKRLLESIIRHLEVTITNVHLRYEDKQSNQG